MRRRNPKEMSHVNLQKSLTFFLKTKMMKTLFKALKRNWKDQHVQQITACHPVHKVREETPRRNRVETRVWTATIRVGSRRRNTCELIPGSHLRKSISFDVSPRDASHSDTNFTQKADAIHETQNKQTAVHFTTLMDLCHLKHTEMAEHWPKCKGLVVLRGDIVKDDKRMPSTIFLPLEWLEKQMTQSQPIHKSK